MRDTKDCGRQAALKGLVYKLTRFKLQCRENTSKNTRDIWGKIKLAYFRVRYGKAGVRTTQGTEALAGTIFLCGALLPPNLP